MKPRRDSCLLLLLSAVLMQSAVAEGKDAGTAYRLTLEQALDLARSRSPAVLRGQARIAAANARIVGASVRFRENPSLEVGGGPRSDSEGKTHDFEIGLSQTFELGGKRGARIDSATAGLDRATATAGDRLRGALQEAAVAFLRARHVEERLRVAREVEKLSVELSEVATSRYDSGDVGILDVNLASVTVARVQAEVGRLQAARERSLGDLRIVLGLEGDSEITLVGDLLERRRYELATLLSRASGRADLRVIEASLRGVDADLRLAKAHSWPEFGLGVAYAREEQADIVTGGLTVSLPVFHRGQGLEADAVARGDALRLDLETRRTVINVEVRAAYAVYQHLVQAVGNFEKDGLSLMESTDELSRLSYEAGALGLGELLTARRELIEARVSYTDLLLETALAGLDVEAAAGLLQ